VGLPVTVDGVYGQETADAVMAFQEREQLMTVGVVGSETGEALDLVGLMCELPCAGPSLSRCPRAGGLPLCLSPGSL
jgi:hypothetical protein